MRKQILCVLLAFLISLSGCAQAQTGENGKGQITIVATTYPVYLFTRAVTSGMEGVAVERLSTGETSCLHDYTLSVNDMKKLERADVIALSGAGLEDFMEDVLATSTAAVIDCSQGVELMENLSHHHDEGDHSYDGHDHGHFDPHYWLDPDNAILMAENLSAGLGELVPQGKATYAANAGRIRDLLPRGAYDCHRLLDGMGSPKLITFHDGFQYFASAFELELLESIEEEAGSEASAKEIVEITGLVQAHGIPGVFTEVNGSDATAQAVARETGCRVAQLTMLMDGHDFRDRGDTDDWVEIYLNGLKENIMAIADVYTRE